MIVYQIYKFGDPYEPPFTPNDFIYKTREAAEAVLEQMLKDPEHKYDDPHIAELELVG